MPRKRRAAHVLSPPNEASPAGNTSNPTQDTKEKGVQKRTVEDVTGDNKSPPKKKSRTQSTHVSESTSSSIRIDPVIEEQAVPILQALFSKPDVSGSSSGVALPGMEDERSGLAIANKSVKASQAPDKKRVIIPGQIRKLGLAQKRSTAATTLSGHRIPLPSVTTSSLATTNSHTLEVWVSRKSSFTAYLKRVLKVLISGASDQVEIVAVGAAISTAMSLAMAVEDAIAAQQGQLLKTVKTGTIQVTDEITPSNDEASDIVTQHRNQSSIEIVLKFDTTSDKTSTSTSKVKNKHPSSSKAVPTS